MRTGWPGLRGRSGKRAVHDLVGRKDAREDVLVPVRDGAAVLEPKLGDHPRRSSARTKVRSLPSKPQPLVRGQRHRLMDIVLVRHPTADCAGDRDALALALARSTEPCKLVEVVQLFGLFRERDESLEPV